MYAAFDAVIKKHIESFLKVGKRKIPVYGLQNEDESDESVMSQAGGKDDKIRFPLISVFRNADIEITDNSNSKKPATFNGYVIVDDKKRKVQLNDMRCDLMYTVDTFAENKKTAEDIGTQLYFRLRNNCEVTAEIVLPFKDENGEPFTYPCTAEIVLQPTLRHLKPQSKTNAQLYKFRFQFKLINVNIYDVSIKEAYKIEYVVTSRLSRN